MNLIFTSLKSVTGIGSGMYVSEHHTVCICMYYCVPYIMQSLIHRIDAGIDF